MTSATSLTIEVSFAVKHGKSGEVDAVRKQLLDKAGVDGVSHFEALLSDDKDELTIRTSAPEEEPIRQLLLCIGPVLEALERHASVKSVNVVGAPSAPLRKALGQFSATFA